MLRFILSLLASFFIAAVSATGQTPVDLARQAIDTGDFVSLETLLEGQTKSARETRDFTGLRNLYATLFETANSKRLARQEAWLAEIPDSPYAATALGWSHMRLAERARGVAAVRFTSGEAFAAHRKERALAQAMVDRALKNDPGFVPALDLALVLAMYGGGQAAVPNLVEQTLAVAPDTHAVVLGLRALMPRWGGSLEQQLALCETAKATLPGFDDDICLIYLAFTDDLGEGMRKRALVALETRDEPFLDFARADAYRKEWRGRPEAAESAMAHLMKLIRPGADFDRLASQTRLVANIFKDPFFEMEAEDALRVALRETLRDSPEDYRLLGRMLDEILDEGRPGAPAERADEARALWKKMLVLGSHDPGVWAAGVRLEGYLGNWARPAVTGPYFVNDIYYSNHDPNSLTDYLVTLFRLHEMAQRPESLPVGTTPDALDDEHLLCPMFRAQRLYEAVCAAWPDDLGCNSAGADANVPDEVRRLMSKTATCLRERTAPVEELLFQPVPVAHFSENAE